MKWLLAFSFFFGTTLVAADSIAQLQEAAVYAEAGRYDRAQAIYQTLLEGSLPSAQRNSVTYNLGVLLMEQRRWEEAIKLFYQIALTPQDSPLLQYRYHYNLAVALLSYAKEHEGIYSIDDPAFIDRFKAMGDVLGFAQNELVQANSAYCVLLKAKGQEKCTVPAIADNIQEMLKLLSTSLEDQQALYRLAQLSANGKLARLWVAIGQILKEISAQDTSWNPIYADQLAQLQPLWDSLRLESLSEPAKAKALDAALASAQAREVLGQDNRQKAVRLLQDSQEGLYAALQGNQGEPSPLSQLVVDYSIALAHRTLTVDQMTPFTAKIELLNREGALSQQTQGIAALKAGQLQIARIFFSDANFSLREPMEGGTPLQLFTALLEEQKHAMQVVAAVMDLPSDQRQPKAEFASSLHDTMRQAQARYVPLVAPLVSSVLALQKNAFKAEGTKDKSCQRFPWSEAMPLFFLGESAALRASELLSEPKSSLSTVFDYQKVAYRKWLKAIELLQENTSGASQQSSKEDKDRTWWTEDTQRLLLQMNREDREKTPTQRPVSLPEGGKPW